MYRPLFQDQRSTQPGGVHKTGEMMLSGCVAQDRTYGGQLLTATTASAVNCL